jgi:hypothetical protein
MKAPFEVNVSSTYGAPYGRHSDDAEEFTGQTVQLRKVPVVDGDYDPGGAYWGSPTDLYCAWNDELTFYCRAGSREDAMAKLPGAVFEVPKVTATGAPDAFFYAYVEAALWSSTDESDPSGGVPLDTNYCFDDLDPECATKMRTECDAFYAANANDIYLGGDDQAGHDFWLARNGHGVGFDDRDCYGDDGQGDRLQDAARQYREVHLYIENDKVYCE